MKNNDVSKITTIIGLVFELFTALFMFLTSQLLLNLPQSIVEVIESENLPAAQEALVFDMLNILGIIVFIISLVSFSAFLVNQYLFRRLIRGDFNASTRKNIFLYQAIWGGINIAFNTIVGALYLISGIYGLNKISNSTQKEKESF